MTQWLSIDRTQLPAALAAFQRQWDVFAPIDDGNGLRTRKLPAGGTVFLGPRKPLLPLKTLFLPEEEELFTYTAKGPAPEVIASPPLDRERLVIGALACDLAALDIIDRVFLADPADDAYRRRREQTILVASACIGEGPECFCTSFGIDPLRPSGADALLIDTGEVYLLSALTKKGKRVTRALGVGKKVKDGAARQWLEENAQPKDARERFPIESITAPPMELWELPVWEELAARCRGCGVCTVLCPTCHCFDIEDQRRGKSGTRFRCWDTCMNPGFTLMASGENPRPGKRERVRQRFLHKLSYFPREKGITACVGCGRCTARCPVGIGINQVIQRLAKEEATHE
jgi:ferredoxin